MPYTPGLHILMSLDHASDATTTHVQNWLAHSESLIIQHGLTCVGMTHHQFDNLGFTAALCLKESHICVHTWPEFAHVTIDVFLCHYSADHTNAAEAIAAEMVQYFEANITKIERVKR